MENFVVIALATSVDPNFVDCHIVPEGSQFVATHRIVFGPASQEECRAFVSAHCHKQPGPDLSGRRFVILLAIYLLLMLMASVYALNRLMSANMQEICRRACSEASPTPTPSPSPTPQSSPTASPTPPTSTPSPTGQTPSPSPSPSPRQTASPTSSGNAAASPTKSPTVTPSPTPNFEVPEVTIPAVVYVEVWPFSGYMSGDAYVFLVIFFAGMLGSIIRAVYSMIQHLGLRDFARNWMWFYIFLPFSGAALSLVIYFVVRGGFYGASFGKGLVLNLFSFAALGALTGLFSENAMEKLKQVANSLLTTVPPKVADAKAETANKK